ncbi:MAG: hypothetical protein CMP48_00515 [Rickettsiales bacterium]|nr:hypothetical protein [Rickettsiales bacterium]
MKHALVFLLILILISPAFCQKHHFFVKGGIVAVDGPISIEGKDNVGPNFEVGYSYSLRNWLSIGINHGYARFNTFPEIFRATQEQINGVNPEVDQYIKSLSMSDAMFLGWSRSNFIYLSPNIELFLGRIAGVRIGVNGGLVFQRNSQISFFLDEFTMENDSIVSYTPQYMFVERLDFGYTLGVSLKEKIVDSLNIVIDAKFHAVDLRQTPTFGHDLFGVVRIGLEKQF